MLLPNPARKGHYFQIIHNRITKQVHTGYKLFLYEWDATRSEIIRSGSDTSRLAYLISLKETLAADTLRLKSIISKLEKAGGTYTTEKVVELFYAPENDNGFISFTSRLINQLRQIGKKRTADTYTTVLSSFKRFREKQDLLLDDVDSALMMEYETWLKENGIC